MGIYRHSDFYEAMWGYYNFRSIIIKTLVWRLTKEGYNLWEEVDKEWNNFLVKII